MKKVENPQSEWIETDGLGGFASGTVGGERTRRYHAVLLSAASPPIDRIVLVNGFDAILHSPEGDIALSTQRYSPDVTAPNGIELIESFTTEPWPTWGFRIDEKTTLVQELFVAKERAATLLRWTLIGDSKDVRLEIRPFVSGRDHHALHHENPVFDTSIAHDGDRISLAPYPGLPEISIHSNGRFTARPEWYRNFLYQREHERGLDCVEDLVMPGSFELDLAAAEGLMVFSSSLSSLPEDAPSVNELFHAIERDERRRRDTFPSGLHRKADSFFVRRGDGRTIVAGYPWFTDWGRDTFISLRGLCLSTGEIELARDILLQWSGEVRDGMLPNFFPDGKREPEYNTVDAALWFIVAAYELTERAERKGTPLAANALEELKKATDRILSGYSAGSRYKIGRDESDGLLRAGEPGVQLTWMDAKVGDWVVTPRIGKPVEIQALWLNALRIGSEYDRKWQPYYEHALESFLARFWNEERGCLFDVVDVDHQPGQVDPSVRPNQLLAVGGLPFQLVSGERARSIVDCAGRLLVTPNGVRTLSPGDEHYAGRYAGGPRERDGAYHQGTAWPWLLGPFVEAWVRVRGGTAEAKNEANARFIVPIEQRMESDYGVGYPSEISDGDPPFSSRGCPFQAWSLGELIRLKLDVLSISSPDQTR